MTSTPGSQSTALDDDELLHLALRAMNSDQHDEALSILKRAIDGSPGNAQAHYLLGAEHAQLGMYDRAVVDMAEAVRLAPELAAARFQLGLLHLTAGRIQDAELAWQPLERLGANDPLRLFASALQHLVHDEMADCVRELEAGIAANHFNEALNEDMRQVLADLQYRQRKLGLPAADPGAGVIRMPKPSGRTVLPAYDRNRDGEPD
jgi:tetratricopeptide (TPR) repeat protein